MQVADHRRASRAWIRIHTRQHLASNSLVADSRCRRHQRSGSRVSNTSSRPCPVWSRTWSTSSSTSSRSWFGSRSPTSQTLYLSAKGAGVVKAGTSRSRPELRSSTPIMHIATLQCQGRLEMEMTVAPGSGLPHRRFQQGLGSVDRGDPDRFHLLPVRKVCIPSREHPGRSDDQLRSPGARCRDQRRY